MGFPALPKKGCPAGSAVSQTENFSHLDNALFRVSLSLCGGEFP